MGNLGRRGVVKHDTEFTGQAPVYGVETVNNVFAECRGRPLQEEEADYQRNRGRDKCDPNETERILPVVLTNDGQLV